MMPPLATFLQDTNFIRALYILAFICFIFGLRLVTHPSTARRGNLIAAIGMAIAVAATLLIPSVGDYGLIALGIAIAFGTINVVGGFLVTDRMLEMFKKRPAPKAESDGKPEGS